jgi:phage-related minor tail protein
LIHAAEILFWFGEPFMTDDSDDDDDATGQLSGSIDDVRTRTNNLTVSSNSFARAISSAFAQGASGAKSFDSVLKSLALRLSSLSVTAALKPLTNSLFSGSTSLFGGTSSGITGGTGAEDAGSVQPFATGGVIATPNFFPLGNNQLGVAGEAGPEAIMPLARGPDGRLGVAAGSAAAPNVTVNIATPDADSFRRSDTYLTGLIARAVARGQRGL